jgi:predicted outer membrane repeat protein
MLLIANDRPTARRAVATLTLTLTTLCGGRFAAAQSINFDFSTNFGSGPWFNAPADTYGGAHGQTGFWLHSEAFNSWTNLPGLDGNPTTADLTKTGGQFVSFMDHPVLSGEVEKMIGDWNNAPPANPITLTFSNLIPGVYTVYTYAVNPIFDDYRSSVSVNGSPDGVQSIGGEITVNGVTQGITHARHRVQTNGSTITIHITAGVNSGSFNGIQLVYHGFPATRMYVDQDATGSGTGLNWPVACVRLDDALTAAAISDNIEEIWVAEGLYRPTRNGNRGDSFVIRDGLKVYGGFAGNETKLGQRDIDANPTVLTGAINNPLLAFDNCYHVVDLTNTTFETRLDGFRISNGYASGGAADSLGGGVYLDGSSASVRNCLISSNHAEVGGGLWTDGDSPDIVNCTFLNNTSDTFGGGLRVLGGDFVVSVYNCTFLGNDADTSGGGASINGQSAWFINCLFSGNHSIENGGAIHASGDDADILIINSTIAANDSDTTCGGVYMNSSADDDIQNSILWGNTDSDPLTNTRQAQYFAFDGTSTQTLDYNIVQGWNIAQGVGNNGSNPLFIDSNGIDDVVGTQDDDLRVQNPSPAIDSGNTSEIPIDFVDLDDDGVFFELTSLDLDGHARQADVAGVPDTGSGATPMVDRGAYEVQALCAADTNGSGAVDVDDLVAVILGWGPCGNCAPPNCPADVNGSCAVDVDDLIAVILAWGACP